MNTRSRHRRKPRRALLRPCNDNVAEICDHGGSYHELADCDLVSEPSGAPFVCANIDETMPDGHITGHTCVPESEAPAADGGGR